MIGGAGSTGKTCMAQRLLQALAIPYTSMDHIKMGLVRGWPHCPFGPQDEDAHITRWLWPVVQGMAQTAAENGQNITLEGCYILPEGVRRLSLEYPGDIICFFLGFSTRFIQQNYETAIVAHRNAIERRLYPEERPAARMAAENEAMRAAAAACGAPFFEMDGDYEQAAARVCAWVRQKWDEKRS